MSVAWRTLRVALSPLEFHTYLTRIDCAHNKQPVDCKLSQPHICLANFPVSSQLSPFTHSLRVSEQPCSVTCAGPAHTAYITEVPPGSRFQATTLSAGPVAL